MKIAIFAFSSEIIWVKIEKLFRLSRFFFQWRNHNTCVVVQWIQKRHTFTYVFYQSELSIHMTAHLFYYTLHNCENLSIWRKKCLFCVFFPIERVVFIFCKAGASCITAFTIFVKYFRSTKIYKLFVEYFLTVNGCISGSISLIGVVNYNWIAGDEISTLNFSPFLTQNWGHFYLVFVSSKMRPR